MAGMTLLVIAVPEQLATSRLAGMPAATALWAFVAATVAFFLLGSSKLVSVGADSTIAPLFAVAVAHLAVSGSPKAIALTSLTALVTGAIVLAIGLLRLGWIADLLSVPIITGFMVGVAVIITVHQLPDLLGTGAASGSTVHRLNTIFRDLHSTRGWSLAIGLVVLAIILICEKIDRRIPAALIGLVGSTLLVGASGLSAQGGRDSRTGRYRAPEDRYPFSVVGRPRERPSGIPHCRPRLSRTDRGDGPGFLARRHRRHEP